MRGAACTLCSDRWRGILGIAMRFEVTAAPPVDLRGEDGAWRKEIGGSRPVPGYSRPGDRWRRSRPCSGHVFAGMSDLDVAGPGTLIVVPETGGDVIGAYRAGPSGEELVGFVIGWGGYVDGRPRILSDMLAVRADARGGGLGAELKKLQAALAVERRLRRRRLDGRSLASGQRPP